MTEIMIARLKATIKRELQYFLDRPEKVDLKSIDGAIARCFGALTLTTEVLYELGQKDLADSLGNRWDEIDRPAFYDILYKSWGL